MTGLTKRSTDLCANTTLNGRAVPHVNKYKSARSVNYKDGRSEGEMIERIGMVKSSFGKQ